MSEVNLNEFIGKQMQDFGRVPTYAEVELFINEHWKKQLTAAQAEIAELKEIIKREVVPDIKDAEIARLKDLSNEARNVIRMKNEKIEDLSSQVKSILAKANDVANKNLQLQSALDVAVEGLEKMQDVSGLNSALTVGLYYRKIASSTLDKIKQIREKK